MHYTPHVDLAFNSVEHIMRDVEGGWLLCYMHANGASMFLIVVYLHLFRGLYHASYSSPREFVRCLALSLKGVANREVLRNIGLHGEFGVFLFGNKGPKVVTNGNYLGCHVVM
ncbi:hypothetical protein R6Q57_016000 [Mikania cordata]